MNDEIEMSGTLWEWLAKGGGVLAIGGMIGAAGRFLWMMIRQTSAAFTGRFDRREKRIEQAEDTIMATLRQDLQDLRAMVDNLTVKLSATSEVLLAHRDAIIFLNSDDAHRMTKAARLKETRRLLGDHFPLVLDVPADTAETQRRIDERSAS